MKTIQEQIREVNTRLNYTNAVRTLLTTMSVPWEGTEAGFWYSIGEKLMEMNVSKSELDNMLDWWKVEGGRWKAENEAWEKDVITISTSQRDDLLKDIYEKQSIYLEQWVILNDELNSTKEKEQIDGAEVLKPKLYSLKFYADGAGGVSDKLFCYPVHHGGHTADLLTWFIKRGLTIKAAYLVGGLSGEKGVQLGRGELEYLTCTGENEKNRIRAILMSKFPKLG